MKVQIIRKPDDAMALRASIGGREAIGWYLVYRGDPKEVLAMLRHVTAAAAAEMDPASPTPG